MSYVVRLIRHDSEIVTYVVTSDAELWSRYLVKQLEPNAHLSHHKYVWYEMGFFALQAAPGHTAVLCFNTPDCFPRRLFEALRSRPRRLNEPAIYQLHAYLTDQVLTLYDESVWAFRDIVRDLERVSSIGAEEATRVMRIP